MTKGRLEAFSDGILAVIITIMVLDLKIPSGADLGALRSIALVFASYVLSFVFIGIYWSNHHHLLHATRRVNGKILWANLHLMFWLSLVPFATNWMGGNFPAEWPVAVYGFVLLMAAIAYFILSRSLVEHDGRDSLLSEAVGKDRKGGISIVVYALAIGLAFVLPALSIALYVLVAVMWIVPDRRIEDRVEPGPLV